MNTMRGDMNTEFAKLRGDMATSSAVTDAKISASATKLDVDFAKLTGDITTSSAVTDAKFAAVELKLAGMAVSMADQFGKLDAKLDKLLDRDESARNRK
jgi:hypothetical protein